MGDTAAKIAGAAGDRAESRLDDGCDPVRRVGLPVPAKFKRRAQAIVRIG